MSKDKVKKEKKMTEYITKKQAQDILCRGCNKDLHLICRCDKWAEIRRIDGIDIVHCDECIHAFAQPEGDKKNANKIFCVILSIFVDRDFFCAEGKRK